MSKTLRAAVLACALLSSLSMTSTAGAVTWHNDGDTHFTGTGGPIHYSSTGVTGICASRDFTGIAHKTGVGDGWPAFTLTSIGTGCLLAGQNVGLHCTHTFTANGIQGQVVNGVLDTTCGLFLAGVKLCHLEGSQLAHYTNPETGFGVFTVTHGNLTSTNGASNCPLGARDEVTFTHETWTIHHATGGPSAPHRGPTLTRNP